MRDQHDDKDLDLPSFGPAERDDGQIRKPKSETPKASAPTQQSGSAGHVTPPPPAADAPAASSGGALSYLIILLLAAAVGGLAYWSYLQHQQIVVLEQQMGLVDQQRAEIDQQVLELQQLLQVAESSAAQSGESLLVQVKKQAASTAEKHKQLDSEIAKLWTVAHQRNAPKIAELEKQLKAAEKRAADQLKQQEAKLAQQLKQSKSLATKLASVEKALQAAEKKAGNRDEQMAAVKSSAAALTSEFEVLSETVDLMQEEQRRKLSAFAEQIVELQQNQNSAAGIERRVRVNEQAIRAIDGSRVQLNKELLQIRSKLNSLQLKVEQL